MPLSFSVVRGTMTRGELKKFCKTTLNAGYGSEESDNPITWDILINQAADDLCRATDCLWYDYSIAITAGKSVYNCMPLYKLRKVQAQYLQGTVLYTTNVQIQQAEWTPYSFNSSDTNPRPGIPTVCSLLGTHQLRVYPVPNYTLAGALTFSGYGVPGNLWPNDTDSCPLPDWAHLAVAYGAMIDRGIQFPISGPQMQLLQSRYKQMRGRLEAEAATNTRAKAIQVGDGLESSYSGYSPLDL